MRKIFEEYGYSQFDVENRVMECWNNLFDLNNPNHIYFEDEDDTGYILDTGNNDVRTEGQSYGMMMAVQMDRKDIFDRIWKWTHSNMYLDKGPSTGYFCWSCQRDGRKNADGPAPDGEEYFVMALFFAAERWGNGTGIFNYEEEARAILRTAIHGPSPMWDLRNHLIRFVCNCPFTDPSYHVPHFYEIFAQRCDEEDREFWQLAAESSRKYLVKACHPETGLAPEYATDIGLPLPPDKHGTFFSDSYRVAANIGMDALWCGFTPELSEIAMNIINFFDGKSVDALMDYSVEGKRLGRKARHPYGLIATVAQAVAALENPDTVDKLMAERALKRFWELPMRTGKRRYYDNCLYFFAMLALSGRYIKY